jgi:hypothetical protein
LNTKLADVSGGTPPGKRLVSSFGRIAEARGERANLDGKSQTRAPGGM